VYHSYCTLRKAGEMKEAVTVSSPAVAAETRLNTINPFLDLCKFSFFSSVELEKSTAGVS